MTQRLLALLVCCSALAFASEFDQSALRITKYFGYHQIPQYSSTSLTFTISTNRGSASNVSFSDSLPNGLLFTNTYSVLVVGCGDGASVSFNAAQTQLTFSGGAVTSESSCMITTWVCGKLPGVYTNTTSSVTGSGATSGSPASDTLTVVAPPVLTKQFSPAVALPGTNTSVTFTITNPNKTVTLTGIGFEDFAGGFYVGQGAPGYACNGNVSTYGIEIDLSYGSLAPGASCSFTVPLVNDEECPMPELVENITSPICSYEGGFGYGAIAFLAYTAGGVAVDSQGNMIVALPTNNQVLIFSKTGTFRGQLSTGFLGPFNQPAGVAIDSKDNIFVSDTANNRILVFTSVARSFLPLNQITVGNFLPLKQPMGLAVDSKDHLLIADTGNSRIALFSVVHNNTGDASYVFSINQIGPQISFLGKLSNPPSVAVDSQDNIIVADSGNNRVVVFTSVALGTAPHNQIGPQIGFLGQFDLPAAVTVNKRDPNPVFKDQILVLDSGNYRIVAFASVAKGESPVAQIASSPNNGDLSDLPGSIASDPNGNLLVLDPLNNRLAFFADYNGGWFFQIPLTFGFCMPE